MTSPNLALLQFINHESAPPLISPQTSTHLSFGPGYQQIAHPVACKLPVRKCRLAQPAIITQCPFVRVSNLTPHRSPLHQATRAPYSPIEKQWQKALIVELFRRCVPLDEVFHTARSALARDRYVAAQEKPTEARYARRPDAEHRNGAGRPDHYTALAGLHCEGWHATQNSGACAWLAPA